MSSSGFENSNKSKFSTNLGNESDDMPESGRGMNINDIKILQLIFMIEVILVLFFCQEESMTHEQERIVGYFGAWEYRQKNLELPCYSTITLIKCSYQLRLYTGLG